MNLTNILYEEFNLHNSVHSINSVSKNDIVYLLGSELLNKTNLGFTIFQGHHLNLEHLSVDLILPSITFLEKSKFKLKLINSNPDLSNSFLTIS